MNIYTSLAAHTRHDTASSVSFVRRLPRLPQPRRTQASATGVGHRFRSPRCYNATLYNLRHSQSDRMPREKENVVERELRQSKHTEQIDVFFIPIVCLHSIIRRAVAATVSQVERETRVRSTICRNGSPFTGENHTHSLE